MFVFDKTTCQKTKKQKSFGGSDETTKQKAKKCKYECIMNTLPWPLKIK